MKNIKFYGKQDIRLEDSNIPNCGKNDVLVKVMACGGCGTDVHIYEGVTLCIEPFSENVEEVLKKKQIHYISCVIECCGLISTLEQAIRL